MLTVIFTACHDADTAGLYNGYEKDKKRYTDKVLKLKTISVFPGRSITAKPQRIP